MNLNNKKDVVFLVLAGFFITNAIVAELIGGKLIEFFGTFVQSIGIVLWPVVFITTDLVNEYYGQAGVKKLSYLTVALIGFAFLILFVCQVVFVVSYCVVIFIFGSFSGGSFHGESAVVKHIGVNFFLRKNTRS